MARLSWNIQGKVLYVGIEDGGRTHQWKISPTSSGKAAVLREIADVLDPPAAAPRRRRQPDELEHRYEDEDDEEWDPAPRRRPRRAQEPPRQVRTPYPPVDPRGEFSGRQRGSQGFVDHSHGLLPDGTPIETPVPEDEGEAESHARLSRLAYEKAQAHVRSLDGMDDSALTLPIVEARPNNAATRRSQGLDSRGLSFLAPAAHQELGEGQRVRQRPKVDDPAFRYKDTH